MSICDNRTYKQSIYICAQANTSMNYNKIQPYSRNEKPFGKTWEEWTTKWWQWLLSIPRHHNPCLDQYGENFNLNQLDPNVLFLAGSLAGSRPVERTITIHQGKAVLFPIINFITSYADAYALRSEKELLSYAKSNIDDIVKKEVSINGINFNELENYRVQSKVFVVTFPEDNVYGLEPGSTIGASDGYWFFLKPLQPGTYDIRTAGSCLSGKITIKAMLHLDVKESYTTAYT
jgi:hypothetical protein